ncbi:MAG TPA: transporter substrate-binding domain-containing protein [Bryobacteraceae bacterium]|nr:transporter substrate-binding domain-containing protein [Bryobacteraceae bacterium]
MFFQVDSGIFAALTDMFTPVAEPRSRLLDKILRNANIDQIAAEMDFSRVYLLSWSSYIVRTDSAVKTLEDMDRAGVRVGSARGDSPEIYLSRTLRNAALKRYENPSAAEAVRLLRAREIEVWAANRQRLIEMAAGASDLRVLPGNYTGVRQAIAVAKGNMAAVEAIDRFLTRSRDSGLIQAAIERAGLTASAGAAP